MAKHWSRERVLLEIKRRHRKGWALNQQYIRREVRALYYYAKKYFTSWSNAVTAAGISYDAVRVATKKRKEAREKTCAQILLRYRNGLGINSTAIRREDRNLYANAVRQFGSWANAVIAAGIDYYGQICSKSFLARRAWSKSDVITEIRARHARGENLKLSAKGMNPELTKLAAAAIRYFGTWGKAIARAKLEDGYRARRMNYWTKERVRAAIRRLSRTPAKLQENQLLKENPALHDAARRLFGSRRAAIRAAGFHPFAFEARIWWTKRAVLVAIRQAQNQGCDLAPAYIRKNNVKLWKAAWQHWGSWEKAVNAAGINYATVKRIASMKGWLVNLEQHSVNAIIKQAQRLVAIEKHHPQRRKRGSAKRPKHTP